MIGEFFIIKSRISRIVENNFSEKSEKVLDIGCGEKPFYMKNIKGKVICFDIRKTYISDVVGDAMKLPFKNQAFDAVTSINSFYYIDNPFEALEEVSRVLKRRGRFFLIMPFIYPLHDVPIDKYRFTEYGVRDLLKKDFEIKEFGSVGSIFNLPAVFLHSLIKGIPLMFPKNIRKLISFLMLILYPLYLVSQLLSIFDFVDKSKRWSTYYFAIAVKK